MTECTCHQCQETKPIDLFPISNKKTKYRVCKPCIENLKNNFHIYKDNPDNQAIIHKVSNKFSRYLSKEVLQSCQDIGLWQAILTYNKNKRVKFLTHLYNTIKYTCLTELKVHKKKKTHRQITEEDGYYENNYEAEDFSHYMGFLSGREKDICERYFLKMEKMSEIGKVYQLSKQRVEQILAVSKNRIKNYLNNEKLEIVY